MGFVAVVAMFHGSLWALVIRKINKSNKTFYLCELLFDLEDSGNKQINNFTPYILSSEDDVARNEVGRETDWGEG